jgi:hypothetical protein
MIKLQQHIFDLAAAAMDTSVILPSQLQRAFRQLDMALDKLVAHAQLPPTKS